MTGAPVIAFVPAHDSERARDFYVDVIGLRFVRDDGFAMVCESGGTMVRIVDAADFTPQPFTVLGWEVADIHAEVARLTGAGVTFEDFALAEDGVVWNAPGGDAIAWFRDSEGNLLSISQHAFPVSNPAPPRE
ncbi:VOC family protein [Demequina sp. NBRC 110056]|uniref:VOC family protein n=1 Tax=Demequina sp. NBRC 110056 TaxID=1570345 RepID=UPI0009FD6A51|nr:VOC family protein [Demequina sp. NBRC 110056]